MAVRRRLSMDDPAPLETTAGPREHREQPIGRLRAARPASREGKLQFAGYLSVEAKRQIDVYAAMNGLTGQAVFEEMVEDWFAKHGLHRLAKSRS
jgi:hypothetical protein